MRGKVLITGAAGFMGLHLARRLLEDGFWVDLVDNFERGVRDNALEEVLENPSSNFFNIDCLSTTGTNVLSLDYDYIFNLAAIIGVEHVLRKPYRVLIDNIKLMDNIIKFARIQKKLKRFMYPSTSEVTAGTLEYFDLPIPTPEDTPLALMNLSLPRTSYMLSKISGEYLCHFSGIPYTIFRPHNVYGPRMGMAHVVPGQLSKAFFAKDGDQIGVPSVDQTRCFCFIDDAIEQLVRMMLQPKAEGETLNLGTEKPETTILEIAKICHFAVGRELIIKSEPSPSGSPQRRSPDMKKTNKLIGFSSQISLEEGIQKTYEWYQKNVFHVHGITAN